MADKRPPTRAEHDREREARRALDRVERETETVGHSSGARIGKRVSDHFSGRDAQGQGEDGGTDPVEVWGRRIGRLLAVPFFIFLVVSLGLTLGWW